MQTERLVGCMKHVEKEDLISDLSGQEATSAPSKILMVEGRGWGKGGEGRVGRKGE